MSEACQIITWQAEVVSSSINLVLQGKQLQVFLSPGITCIKAWAGTTTTDIKKEQLLWLKGELSLWGLFANTAGMGATGHELWHFFAVRWVLVQWEKGWDNPRASASHASWSGRDQGWMQFRCCQPFWCWGHGVWCFSYLAIFDEQKAPAPGGMWLLENFHIHRF